MLLSLLPKGSEVIVPSFTFAATIHAIRWNGLVPVYADIDRDTFNVAPESVRQVLSSRTSAILAVHVFGAPASVEELQALASEHGVNLFFDSAHAFGSKHGDEYVGQFGDAEVFSFSATKLLVCGEGGAIVTKRASIFEPLLAARNYGRVPNSRDCSASGLNGKITEFGAMLGTLSLSSVEEQVQRRQEIAAKYVSRLEGCAGLSFQEVPDDDLSTYKDFAVLCDQVKLGVDRESLAQSLKAHGIETGLYFSPAAHQSKYFAALSSRASLRNTEFVQERVLCLPMYSDMSDEDVEYVVHAMLDAVESHACEF
jgi:dTDP-4-amino-4,6-dideoxygalactose transaminase